MVLNRFSRLVFKSIYNESLYDTESFNAWEIFNSGVKQVFKMGLQCHIKRTSSGHWKQSIDIFRIEPRLFPRLFGKSVTVQTPLRLIFNRFSRLVCLYEDKCEHLQDLKTLQAFSILHLQHVSVLVFKTHYRKRLEYPRVTQDQSLDVPKTGLHDSETA